MLVPRCSAPRSPTRQAARGGRRSLLGLAWLAAGPLACAGAEAPPPAPPRPPPAAVVVSAPVAQVFAEHEVEFVFGDPERRQKLQAAFPAIDALAEAELREGRLPGFVLGVVIDGELAYQKGFGVVDVEKKAAPDADTVYSLGPVGKSFTALAALALRDDGALRLDEPLTRLLPEAAGLVYPTRDAPPITLRQLLTHTSGLPAAGRFEAAIYDHAITEEEMLTSLAGLPLERAPGAAWSYSNLGYGLLGLALERAASSSLRSFVGKRLLTPLGMASSTYDPETLPPARVATPYRHRLASGSFERAARAQLGAAVGAGNLYASLRDVARYAAFQLAAYPPGNAPEAGPVRRSSVREAHAEALRAAGLSVQSGATAGERPVVANADSYGYGWFVDESCDFERLVSHAGGVAGYSSSLLLLPESGVGVIALTNLGPFGNLSIARKALLELKKGGGLAKRAPRAKRLSPAFEVAMPKLLGVLNAWSEEGYRAMLTRPRYVALEDERAELAAYHAAHGACRSYSPIEGSSPTTARFALQCERGALEMEVALNPSDGLIRAFTGTSREIAPPPELAQAAERLAGLVGKWDAGVYQRILAPRAKPSRPEIEASFGRLRAAHGICKVSSFSRHVNRPRFRLTCERGGDLTLSAALDEKRRELVVSYAFSTESAGACVIDGA
ncbi:MAG: beta-lactamase family protein [Polyangiaceae bacterium]|nr:beta-lactamase family protein [Polyangiaceae bacterium]